MVDVTTRSGLKAFLDAYGFSPMKQWGQHFLVDGQLADRLVTAARIPQGGCVLEIGPGAGALTGRLLQSGARVLTIEIDRGLAEKLRQSWIDWPLWVIGADALKLNWTSLTRRYFDTAEIILVGNLPYYVTGMLIARLWEERDLHWTHAVLMLQREAAERLLAEPGSSAAGVPSVLIRAVGTVRRLFDVPARAFYPVPDVASTLVEVWAGQRPHEAVEGALEAVVKAGFGQRRKTLRQALATLGPKALWWQDVLNQKGIDATRRAESLKMPEWMTIAHTWAEERKELSCGLKVRPKGD